MGLGILKQFINESIKAPVWLTPKVDDEYEEILRHARTRKQDPLRLREMFLKGKIDQLTDDMWSALANSDSWKTTAYSQVKSLAEGYGKDAVSIYAAMLSGKPLPMPMIVLESGQPPTLVAGNTRLMVARSLGVRPLVLVARVK